TRSAAFQTRNPKSETRNSAPARTDFRGGRPGSIEGARRGGDAGSLQRIGRAQIRFARATPAHSQSFSRAFDEQSQAGALSGRRRRAGLAAVALRKARGAE